MDLVVTWFLFMNKVDNYNATTNTDTNITTNTNNDSNNNVLFGYNM